MSSPLFFSASPASSTPSPKKAVGKKGAAGKGPKPAASATLTASNKNVYVIQNVSQLLVLVLLVYTVHI